MALGVKDLKKVRKILLPVKRKWYDIGVELNIDPDTLDRIRDEHPNSDQECLTKMLKEWLKSTDPKPTLEALQDALREEAVNEIELAEKVAGNSPVADSGQTGMVAQQLQQQHLCLDTPTPSPDLQNSLQQDAIANQMPNTQHQAQPTHATSPVVVTEGGMSNAPLQEATHFAVPISVPLKSDQTNKSLLPNSIPASVPLRPQETQNSLEACDHPERLTDPIGDISMDLDDLPNPDVEAVTLEFSIRMKEEHHKVRDYQLELAQPGMKGENYIMIAPTGSGKTLTAALVISDHLKKHQLETPCHVAFVTETKPLADQQAEELAKLIPEARVGIYTGNTPGKVADSIKQSNHISVCTAGKLLEEIKPNQVSFDQLSLIVFDECHHTKKGHPFSKLMELYLQYRGNPGRDGKMPQVIGMTASPGGGENPSLERQKTIDYLLHLAARMDATGGFKTITENLEELQDCTKSSEFNSKILNPRDISNDRFFYEISLEMERLERLVSNNLMKNNFIKWSQEYETKVQQVKSSLELSADPSARDDISTLNLLRCYSNALSFYMDMEQKDAIKVIEEHASLPDDDTKCTPREFNLKLKKKALLQTAKRIPPKRNPLMESMEKILCDTFQSSPTSRGIVFVRTKRHSHAMCEWVLENPAFKEMMIKPDVLTGHTRETGEGMTQTTQEEVMSSFREGHTNLLIATSVAEEGLDIPECNLMIRYEHVTNEIAKVQTEGRARAENSHGYFLSSSSRKKFQEFKNQALNMLVEKILENQWFPTGVFLKEKLVEIQHSIIEQKKLKSLLKREQRQTHRSQEIKLLCRRCKAFACYGSDIYTIADESNTAFHYIVPGADFTKRYFHKKHHTPADLVRDKIKKTDKIYCSKCENDWGVRCIWPTEGHIFPVIKCRGFIFEIRNTLRMLKKWKEAPFKMQSLSTWLSDDDSSSDDS